MTNKEIKEHIKKVKNIVGDNDVRKDDSILPCCIDFYNWKADEIDNTPEDFNWKEFWKDCKEEYPLHSVSGGYHFNNEEKIIYLEEKKVEINLLRNLIETKSTNPSVLEIGYGFGGAAKKFENNGFIYTGIDYISSNKDCKNEPDKFIEISENGIPENILIKDSFDLVYSENVFQHLTKKQRVQYYNEAYTVLKDGGVFFFNLLCKNDEFFDEKYTEEEIKKLNYATNFFGVHTYVPYKHEVINTLEDIGFIVTDIRLKKTSDERTYWVTIMSKKEKINR